VELTLKRGSGRSFTGTNWQAISDKKWEVHALLVPSGKEKLVGCRLIDDVTHSVFLMLNDEYFAQPTNVCELPMPEDPMTEIYSLDVPETEETQSTSKNLQSSKVLVFSGKNWKLSSDKKWKSSTSIVSFESKDKVGEKKIGPTMHDIYRTSPGFIAVRQSE
jgi:hypothetical protein